MSYYRQQLESWLSDLEVEADTVYDIGGAQGSVEPRVAKWNVKNYKVLDLPLYDLESGELYYDYNSAFSPFSKLAKRKKADVIFCLEVFEYLLNPKAAIRNIELLLKKGGKAYVTFAFVYPHHNELEMDSLRYTEPAIRRLAGYAGLEIKIIWYRNDISGKLVEFYMADGMRMAKQYPNHSVTGFIVEFEK